MSYNEDVNVNLNVLAGSLGGITAIMSGMSALTSTFGEFGTQAVDNFGAIDGLLVSSTALITAFSVESANAFGEYEQGMKIVQTVSGQAGYSINELSQKAQQLSVDYRTAIGDVTEGLQTLGRAGLNSSESQIEVLTTGLQTAKLEGRNLNGVLEEIIQNTAMLGGDLKDASFGADAEYLNSLMVGTSMTAPITSHDISQTLQYSGGTMAAAGGNLDSSQGKAIIEDYMGTVAAFAQKGVTGSMAGTALRAFFTKPASQDKGVLDAFERLGMTPDELWEADGNSMKKVSEQIQIIHDHMKKLNLSTMDQVELWGKIVGPKMGQQMMKLDESSIKDLTSDIQNAQSAEALATQTLDTYNQKISEMGQQGQQAYREFGSHVATYLTPVIEVVTKIFELLSNPWVNTAVFIGAGALLTHGFYAAWNMIMTVKNEIKALISDAVHGIQNMTGSAEGFGGGIADGTSKVDVLNARLKETDSILANIQAKSLGVRNMGYMMTGGTTTEQADTGILKEATKNYFRGTGVIGELGVLYEPNEIERLTDEAKSANKDLTKSKIKAEIEKGSGKLRMEYFNWSQREFDDFLAEQERALIEGTEHEQALARYTIDKNTQFKEHNPNWNAGGRYRGFRYTVAPEETMEMKMSGQVKASDDAYTIALKRKEAQAIAKLNGSTGLLAKTQEVGRKRLQGYSNVIQQGRNSLNSFARSILGIGPRITPKIQAQAMSVMNNVGSAGKAGLIEALLGLNEITGLTGEKLLEFIVSVDGLEKKFIEMGLITEGDIVATEGNTIAKEGSTLATILNTEAEDMNTLSKIKNTMAGGLESLVGALGGAFMVAIMGATLAMQAFQQKQQEWQKKVQDSIQAMDDAISAQKDAEDTIREEYSKNHEDATDLEKQDAVLAAYAQIYDSTSDNAIKLDENTAELMRNTEAYKNKVDLSSQPIVNDPVFGQDKWGSEFSNRMGTFSNWISDFGSDMWDTFTFKLNTSDRAWYNINDPDSDMYGYGVTAGYERTSGAGYFDSNNVVLTASQSDENYPWVKEFAPIIAADIWDLGPTEGLRQAFGGDVNKILDILQSQTGQDKFGGTAWSQQAMNIEEYFKDPAAQNQLQFAMKNYKEDFTNLGYQMRLYEKNTGGRSVLRDFMMGGGATTTNKANINRDKGYKELTKQSKKDTTRLINYIKSLAIKTGMSEQRVLLAAQLQQLQVMQELANDVVKPNMLSQTAEALKQTSIASGTYPPVEESAYGAVTAGENARAIAALLQVEMEKKLQEGAKTEAIDRGISEAESRSPAEVYAKGREEYDKMKRGEFYDEQWAGIGEYYLSSYARANGMMWGRTGDSLNSFVDSFTTGLKNGDASFKDAITTLRKGSGGAIAQAILDQYDLQAEQANDNSGGSGGSGGNGGSGDGSDKDSGSGTKKERVDLVLCNKKEIPKLNVNLFKKAPNFTVLNKNFRLRDIKINSEDKPKAIMNAVKNGIIETQKRMDPKIIQDETAEYNPVEATDGSSTPSGTTKTTI